VQAGEQIGLVLNFQIRFICDKAKKLESFSSRYCVEMMRTFLVLVFTRVIINQVHLKCRYGFTEKLHSGIVISRVSFLQHCYTSLKHVHYSGFTD